MRVAWLLALLFVCFCALAMQAQEQRSHTHPVPAAGPDWSALQSSMQTMHVAMASVEPSGNSDVDFVRLMLPHHQAAIEMAKAQLLYGKDAQTRRLAQEIITDQQSEIQLMQLWLKQHGSDAPQGNQPPPVHQEKER
jgi:uncharacterized protein (DUF305 family)